MNPLDLLFGQVANAVRQHASPNTPGPAYDSNPILGALGGLLGQHAQQTGQPFNGYDPNNQYDQNYAEQHGPNLGGMLGGLMGGGGMGGMLGGLMGGGQQQNPGMMGGGGYGNVQSSDADPYGDPENQGGAQYGNVLSSDADPYGDPENQR